MSFLGPLSPVELASGAWRTLHRARERLRADHTTLATRQVRFAPQAMVRYYLYIAAAPSRRSERPWDDDQVARAQRFARAFVAEPWTEAPHSADRDVTTFGVTGEDRSFERVLYVRRNGLVELLWALDCTAANDARKLDLMELGRVSAALALAVAGREYGELCSERRWWPAARRTDWELAVSTALPTTDGQRAWTGLRFPGRAPQRATGSRANMPPDGYGREALRSARRRRAPRRVPLVLLRELMAANGYYGARKLDEQLAEESLRQAKLRTR